MCFLDQQPADSALHDCWGCCLRAQCYCIILCASVYVDSCALHKVFKQLSYLGMFGAPTAKPVYLWSNSDSVHDLGTKLDKSLMCDGTGAALARKYVDANGKRRCVGTAQLKESQRMT